MGRKNSCVCRLTVPARFRLLRSVTEPNRTETTFLHTLVSFTRVTSLVVVPNEPDVLYPVGP